MAPGVPPPHPCTVVLTRGLTCACAPSRTCGTCARAGPRVVGTGVGVQGVRTAACTHVREADPHVAAGEGALVHGCTPAGVCTVPVCRGGKRGQGRGPGARVARLLASRAAERVSHEPKTGAGLSRGVKRWCQSSQGARASLSVQQAAHIAVAVRALGGSVHTRVQRCVRVGAGAPARVRTRERASVHGSACAHPCAGVHLSVRLGSVCTCRCASAWAALRSCSPTPVSPSPKLLAAAPAAGACEGLGVPACIVPVTPPGSSTPCQHQGGSGDPSLGMVPSSQPG